MFLVNTSETINLAICVTDDFIVLITIDAFSFYFNWFCILKDAPIINRVFVCLCNHPFFFPEYFIFYTMYNTPYHNIFYSKDVFSFFTPCCLSILFLFLYI